MVVLGRILDLSKQGLVENKRTTKIAMMMVVVVVVEVGMEEKKDNNGDSGKRDKPQRRLPQKGRRYLAAAP